MKRIAAVLLALIMLLALTACGGKGEDVTGKYTCVSVKYSDGSGTPSGEWIELKKGGKGSYYDGTEFDLEWKLKGETFKGTVTFMGLENPMEGTLKDGVIDVKYGDVDMTFAKEGTQGSGTGSSAGAKASAGDLFSSVTVAATMDDAFVGTGSGISSGASGFVSPTKTITPSKMWFGVMQVMNSTDNKDYEKDIIASIAAARDGRTFIEVYTDSSMSDDSLQLSMYITINDDRFAADIGDKDAWVFDRYLTADDAVYFSPVLENGALDMYYHYEDPNSNYSCNVRFFLREDKTLWDEANDPLPPSYDKYKEAIGG